MFLKKSSSLLQVLFRQSKCIVIITKEGSTKIVNFMTPGAGVLVLLVRDHISHIVKMHYFFKNLLLYLLPGIDQKNYICSNDDQGGVFQNCKFHDLQGWGYDVKAWPYKSLQ